MNAPDSKGILHLFTLLAHGLNFFTFLAVREPAFIRRFFAGILIGAGVIAAFVLFGEVLGYAMFGAASMSANPMNLYPTSFPNQNLDADFLACGILAAAMFLLAGRGSRAKKMLSAGLLLLYFAAFALLFSRGGTLALAAGFAAAAVSDWKKAVRFIAYAVIFGLLLLNVSSRARWSLASKVGEKGKTERVTVWKGGLLAFKDKPVFGWGLNGFERAYKIRRLPSEQDVGQYEKTTAFAHNEYLQAAVETGALGLLLWLLFLGLILRKAYSLILQRPSEWERLAAFAGLMALLTHASIDFNLHLPILGFLLAFFSAAASGTPSEMDSPPQPRDGHSRFGMVLKGLCLLWMGVSLYGLGTLWLSYKDIETAVRLNAFSRELLEKLIALPASEARLALVERAVPYHRGEDRLFAYLAREYFRRRRFPESAEAYALAIANNPKNPFYLSEMGDVLWIKKEAAGSVYFYEKALAVEPFYIYPRFRLGEIYLSERKKERASQLFAEILRIREARLPAHSNYTRRLLELPPRALENRLKLLRKS